MTLSDPVADLLTIIRNGNSVARRFVEVKRSKLKLEMVKVLQQQGFIEGFLVKGENATGVIRIYLKYGEGRKPVIHGLKRVSRPGRRSYVGHRSIPKVLGGMGIALLSTPAGILEGKQARERRVGGELLAYVW